MSKSRFIEGLVLGAIAGFFATLLVTEEPKGESSEKEEDTKNDRVQQGEDRTPHNKPEVSVAKTLDAIEKGFDKITKIIDERKTTKQENKQ